MHILALNPFGGMGGAERNLVDIMAGLQAMGDRITVAGPPGDAFAAEVTARGLHFEPWNFSRSTRQMGRYSGTTEILKGSGSTAADVLALLALLRRIQPDLVYSNGVKSHLLATPVCFLTRTPVVWHIHDFVAHRGFSPLLFLMAKTMVSAVLVNSHAVGKEWGDRRIAFTVAHNGFAPRPSCPEREQTPRLRLTSASILAPWKGVDIILRACARLPEDIRWSLDICGDEIYETSGHKGERQRLEDLSRTLGIASNVRFLGMVSDTYPYLCESDIFLHGSIRAEPFGRVIAEAMMASVPVVASRGGGVPEIVEDGRHGLLYPMGEDAPLAACIEALARDPGRRREMGAAARERILSQFSLDEINRRIRMVLMQKARPASGR